MLICSAKGVYQQSFTGKRIVIGTLYQGQQDTPTQKARRYFGAYRGRLGPWNAEKGGYAFISDVDVARMIEIQQITPGGELDTWITHFNTPSEWGAFFTADEERPSIIPPNQPFESRVEPIYVALGGKKNATLTDKWVHNKIPVVKATKAKKKGKRKKKGKIIEKTTTEPPLNTRGWAWEDEIHKDHAFIQRLYNDRQAEGKEPYTNFQYYIEIISCRLLHDKWARVEMTQREVKETFDFIARVGYDEIGDLRLTNTYMKLDYPMLDLYGDHNWSDGKYGPYPDEDSDGPFTYTLTSTDMIVIPITTDHRWGRPSLALP
jgi:hypothetical protein